MTKNILSRIKAREQAIELYAIKWEEENKDKCSKDFVIHYTDLNVQRHTYEVDSHGHLACPTRAQAREAALHIARSEWDNDYYGLENNIIENIQYCNAKITSIRSVLGNDEKDLSDILLRNLHADIEPYLLKLYEMLTESTKDNNVQ